MILHDLNDIKYNYSKCVLNLWYIHIKHQYSGNAF